MDDKDFLGYFEDLKKADQSLLFSTSEKIIQTLLVIDKSASSSVKASSQFGSAVNEGTEYAIKRLVKGMMATTPSIQLNYCFAFGQLLRKFQQIDIPRLLDFIAEQSDKKQALNKQEVHYYKIGRLYCLRAFAESGYAEQLRSTAITKFYELLYQSLVESSWCLSNIIEITRLSLKTNIKEKLKSIVNHGKDFLKEHSLTSIHFLAMLYFVCKSVKIQFNLESYLNDKVFNHKNLQAALKDEVKSFPRKNPGLKCIIQYVKDVAGASERKAEIWQEFWQFLVSNFNEDYKHIFLVLCLMKYYLKDFKLPDLRFLFNEDLIHMWLKNLNVKNKSMAQISQKIENKIVKAIQESTDSQPTPDNKKIITDFFTLVRARTTYRFTPKKNLAKLFFGIMGEEDIQEFYKTTKKKAAQQTNPSDFSFYISDIYVLADLNFSKMSEQQFLDICLFIFQSGTQVKLQQVYQRFPDDVREDLALKSFVKQNQTQIHNYFSSLISNIIRSYQVTQYKSEVEAKEQSRPHAKQLKLFNKDNESLIWKIITSILSKRENFQGDARIYNTLVEIEKNQKFIQDIYQDLQHMCGQAEQEETGLSKTKKVAYFNLVCNVILFNLINTEEEDQEAESGDADNSISQQLHEMREIYFRLKEQYSLTESIQKKRKLSTQSNQSSSLAQIKGSQVLVDLMVSLLTKSPVFLRDSINYCLAQFVETIDATSVTNLLEVIQRPSSEYIQDMLDKEREKDEEEELIEEENIQLEESDIENFQKQLQEAEEKEPPSESEEEHKTKQPKKKQNSKQKLQQQQSKKLKKKAAEDFEMDQDYKMQTDAPNSKSSQENRKSQLAKDQVDKKKQKKGKGASQIGSSDLVKDKKKQVSE